eukprot:gene10899-14630_t
MALMIKKRVDISFKLPQLQNLIKRDPSGYHEEFITQKRHFDSELEIFKLHPSKESERFIELVNFMCHVASCFSEECLDLPSSLMDLLETQAMILHPDVRAKIFQSLILLRNRNILDPILLIKLSFKLFSVNDKSLRMSLGEYIYNDIKAINAKKHNDKVNRSIQAILFNIVTEDTSVTARKTVQILSELYRRRIWTDERTVNVIGSACLSPAVRVVITAVNFFLGIESKMNEDDEDEKTDTKTVKEVNYHEHSKKTRKRQRHVQKQIEKNAKIRKEKENKTDEVTPLFPAIQLLHDPYSLAEKLFKKLRQSGERFEVKLLLMNFVSRLIGCHKLIILSFYSFLQRYLTSHQQDVTRILAYLIQACHELLPPEELIAVIKSIAYNFITERSTNEVIAVGINSVREIIVRVPAVLREPGMDDFIQDLAMYGRKTHKSVMIAAHALINLVREIYPALLRKGDRGKHHNIQRVPAEYGHQKVSEGVDGVELLEAYEKGDIVIDEDDVVLWKGDKNDDNDCNQDEDMNEEDEDDNMMEDHENLQSSLSKSSIARKANNIRNRIDATRVLTNDDFALIVRLKQAQIERENDPKFRSKAGGILLKRKRDDDLDDVDDSNQHENPDFLVEPESLVPGVRSGKTEKIQRIMNVLEGRKDKKFEHEGHKGGLTNKEKLRKKNFMMVRKGKRSVAGKIRKSNSDKRYDQMHKKEQYGRDKRKRRRT